MTTRGEPQPANGLGWLLAAQLVNTTGSAMAVLALAWLVLYDLAGGPAGLSLVLGAQALGLLCCTLPGGLWADRWPARQVLIGANAGCASAQLAIVAAYHLDLLQLPVLATLAFAGAAGTAIAGPASAVLRARVLPQHRRQAGNALLTLPPAVAVLAGPAAGSALIAVTGPITAIAVDATTFLAAAALLSQVRADPAPVPTVDPDATPASGPASAPDGQERPTTLVLLRGGVEAIRERRWLVLCLLGFGAVQLLCAGPLSIVLPVAMTDAYGGAGGYATMLTAVGAGAITGGLLATRLPIRRPLLGSILWFTPVALGPLGLALGAPMRFVVAGFVLLGAAQAIHGALWDTALQEAVPAAQLGRVDAAGSALSLAALPLGQALGALGIHGLGASPTAALAALAAGLLPLMLAAAPSIRGIAATRVGGVAHRREAD